MPFGTYQSICPLHPLVTLHPFYILSVTARTPSNQRRRFTRLSMHCIKLWRDFLVHAFAFPSVLSTPMKDYFHKNHVSFDPFKLLDSYSAYSDSTLHTIGVYVPAKGFSHLQTSSFTDVTLSIANYEFIALVLSFLLAHHLDPSADHVYLFVDNQNAESWSRYLSGINCQLPCWGYLTSSSLLHTPFGQTSPFPCMHMSHSFIVHSYHLSEWALCFCSAKANI